MSVLKLITLEQAKTHMRASDIVGQDGDIELKIEAASAAVIDYLKSYADRFADSNYLAEDADDDEVADSIPPVVKLAVLMQTAHYYMDREGNVDFGLGKLCPQAESLLYRLRDPAYA